MNTMKKAAWLLWLWGGVLIGISAETVREIRIEGELKKTRPSTVQKIIGLQPGDTIQPSDEEAIRQKLLQSGLFVNDSIEVEIAALDESAVVTVRLTDRVSFLPIPIVMSGSGGTKGGVFLADKNFMGLGTSLYAGGLLGPGSRYFTLSYEDPRFLGGPFGIGGSASVSKGEISISDMTGDEEVFSSDKESLSGTLFSSWSTDALSLSFRLGGSYADYEALDKEAFSLSPQLRGTYENWQYDEFFTAGYSISLDYGWSYYFGDFDASQTLSGNLLGQFLPHPRWQLEGKGLVKFYEGETLLSPGSGIPILPKTVRVETLYAASLKVQYALMDFSWAYLALPVSYHVGYAEGPGDTEGEVFHGPMGGVSLLLKKVAIPAISLSYGRNLATSVSQFQFNLGFSF